MTAAHEIIPVLQSHRLVVRPPDERDIPAWFARATDRGSAYLAGDPIPTSISAGKTWLAKARDKAAAGERLLWSIDLRNGPKSVGSVGLTLKELRISFVIGRAFWGQGYATEAVREVLRFGFETKGVSEVESEFVVENGGSRRVHEKLGFQLVASFIDESDGAACERHVLYM